MIEALTQLRDASDSRAVDAAKQAQLMLQQQLDAARTHGDAQAAQLAAAQADAVKLKAQLSSAEVLFVLSMP